jgi:hypothetical protein
VRQWQAIAAAVATIDLETPSRVAGWRNREVVGHLCLQPALLRRFIATAPMAPTGGASFSPPDQRDHARLCRVTRFCCLTR